MYKILILGPQGSGKGTQANLLAEKLGIPALSMGQLLREEIASGSELGQEIASIINEGNLVPDDMALMILQRRLEKPDAANGYILDGYPRNAQQNEAYKGFDQPTAILIISVPRDESLARMKKRAEIEQRADDTDEAIARRLEIYEQETKPIIASYESQGIVHHVDGMGTVEEVQARVNAALGM